MGRKKFYLILDTETATLPFVSTMAKTPKDKQTLAIAKPLVYDIGWTIADGKGNVIRKENYLVQETFFVPAVFNTAYYCAKRPIYMDMYAKGEIQSDNWDNIMVKLMADMSVCDFVAAYNACFDYKKAIPFTERYISNLYSADYNKWEEGQKKSCEDILAKRPTPPNPDYLVPIFNLRGVEKPIVDLWGLACEKLINIDRYRNFCIDNNLLTNSALYFKTSAETSFQYLMKDSSFTEAHTALADAEIETEILAKALKRGKVEPFIKEFPFKSLGTTHDYVLSKRKKSVGAIYDAINDYYATLDKSTGYAHRIANILADLA